VAFSRPVGAGHQVANLVGPAGALAAGYGFHLLGAASYLIPAILLWFSFATIMGFAVWHWRTFFSVAAFLVSAACLIDFQPVFFHDWVAKSKSASKLRGLYGLFNRAGVDRKVSWAVGIKFDHVGALPRRLDGVDRIPPYPLRAGSRS